MSLLLDLPRDTEQALVARAARLGVPVERYAVEVLRREVEGEEPTRQNAISARLAALAKLRELAAGTRAGLPPIPDEAIAREDLYSGRTAF